MSITSANTLSNAKEIHEKRTEKCLLSIFSPFCKLAKF